MTDNHSPAANHSHLWPGVPLALASAILFGAIAPASKVLLSGIAPQMLAGLLYCGAGLGLGLLAAIRMARGQTETGLTRPDLKWLAGAIIMGGVLAPVLLMAGLARLPASSGALLLNLEAVATLAIAWMAFRENVDLRLALGAAAIVAGAAVLTGAGSVPADLTGTALVSGACLLWGLDNNFTKKISGADPVIAAALKGGVAGPVNLGIALFIGDSLPSAALGAAAMAAGLAGIGASLVCYILALRHLGTARTGAYFTLAPFAGAGLAVLFLGEPVTFALLAATALMGGGLWVHLTERHDHDHEHDMLEHSHSHVHDAHHEHVHDGSEEKPLEGPHTHWHRHAPMRHSHAHYPDLHHGHRHS